MIYKNSLKIMMSNFSLVSRILLFMIIHFAIIFGVSYMVALPIINLLTNNGFFAEINSFYLNFLQNLNAGEALSHLGGIFNKLTLIIVNNFATIGLNVIAFLFIFIILGSFFNNFYSLIISNSLYYSMSNNVKYKFLPSLISTLGENIKYSLISLITKLPLTIINALIVLLSFNLLGVGGVVSFFAPLIIVLIYFILSSAKLTLFHGWSPAIIIFDKGIFYGFDKSITLTFRKLKKVFANSFYIILTIFVVNVFSALVTFGAALIVTLPMSVLLLNCFSMVVFYSNYGMRYYVDEFNVVVPIKLEQTEPMKSIKYII